MKQRPSKLGLGTAYIAGLELATGDFIFLLDADLSHHPKYIPEFISKQKEGNWDIVYGSRYIPGGGVYGWSMQRVLQSRVANYLATTMLAITSSDLTGSYRLYKRDVFQALVKEVTAKGYVFQMEIMARARKQGCSIAEVPVTFVDRIFGKSKLGNNEIIGYLKGLVRLFWCL